MCEFYSNCEIHTDLLRASVIENSPTETFMMKGMITYDGGSASTLLLKRKHTQSKFKDDVFLDF